MPKKVCWQQCCSPSRQHLRWDRTEPARKYPALEDLELHFIADWHQVPAPIHAQAETLSESMQHSHICFQRRLTQDGIEVSGEAMLVLCEASSERKLAVPKDAVRCCKLQPWSVCKHMTLDSRGSVSVGGGPLPFGKMSMVLRHWISAGIAKAMVKAMQYHRWLV